MDVHELAINDEQDSIHVWSAAMELTTQWSIQGCGFIRFRPDVGIVRQLIDRGFDLVVPVSGGSWRNSARNESGDSTDVVIGALVKADDAGHRLLRSHAQ